MADIQKSVPGTTQHVEHDTIDEKRAIEIEAQHEGVGNLTGKALDQDARLGAEAEHALTLWEGLKTHRKAVFWSILVSTTIIMEGYDTTLFGSFMGYPTFREKYGVYLNEKDGYQLTSQWQTGISDIQAVGNIIGALGNGYFAPRYGHRAVMMFNLVLMTAFVFVTFFAPNVETLLVGAFLCSIPWGCFATQGPAYAAEVCPLALRGYLTAFVNLCWATGQLLSAGILKGLISNTTEWGYRIPFAIQWIWPIPLFIGAYLCPESPWFLVRAGRLDEAENSLRRLAQKNANVDHRAAVALMVHTTKLEEEEKLGTSYFDCFRGTNLRRTEIACVAFLAQITDGGAFAYNATYFFEQAKIDTETAYAIGLGGTGIAFMGTVLSWFLMSRLGRRTIFLMGFTILVITLYLIGILACINPDNPGPGIQYTQAALCLVWLGVYSLTAGPIVYTLVAEIGATRLRTQTVVLGRTTYYLGNIIGGVLEPYMINPGQWNLAGKTAFFWGTAAFLTTVWAYFRMPETMGRTFEELDLLFLKRVPARKFSSTVLDSDEEFDRNH